MSQGFVLSPPALAQIRARRKTQLRLPAAEKRCPYEPGRLYLARSVNAGWTAAELRDHQDWAGETMPTRARAVCAYLDGPVDDAYMTPAPIAVTVLELGLSTLGHVDQQAAQREGFRFLAQFQNHWRSSYGAWGPEEPVWVISFTVGDFRDVFDRSRLLKATPGHAGDDVDPHQDYTSRPALAMFGEPEAVDARSLERFVAEGLAGHAVRHRAELRRQHVRSATKRLHDAERRNDPEAYGAALSDLQRLHTQIGVAA